MHNDDARDRSNDVLWWKLVDMFHYILMKLTCELYTQDVIQHLFKKKYCNKDFWEMVSHSDSAYKLCVLKNNIDMWEHKWMFYTDNPSTCQEDKDKWLRYKVMSIDELDKQEYALINNKKDTMN